MKLSLICSIPDQYPENFRIITSNLLRIIKKLFFKTQIPNPKSDLIVILAVSQIAWDLWHRKS